MSIDQDSIIVALKASQLDLCAKNARLQERVKEAERELRVWLANSRRFFVQVQEQRDAYAAQSKVRLKALEVARPYLEEIAQDNFIQLNLDLALVCEAIAITPDEALKKEGT